jgi:hypothetical protein
MAKPQRPQPDLDGRWPSYDEHQLGMSIRPLSHGDPRTLLAYLDYH